MQKQLNYLSGIDAQVLITPKASIGPFEDFSEVLNKYGLKYKASDYYYEIGVPQWIQGWIIDISSIPTQFENLLETILPLLIKENIIFKITKKKKIARSIMDGDMGYLLLGKFISIYPSDDTRAVQIASHLIALTKHFSGPEILTDQRLGNIVFTRYGACKGVTHTNENGIEEKYIYTLQKELIKDPYSIPFILPEDIQWPYSSIISSKAPKQSTVLQDRYKPIAILKEDAKGSVKKGLYLEKYWRIKWCIIKEGRQFMFGDSSGRDITDRLRWQYELHKELENIVPMPKIFDLFEENGNMYLVMEFIKGQPLHHMASSILKGRVWIHLPIEDKLKILDFADQIFDIIERMHKKGFIHRDITPANFLVNKKKQLWMIDLELSYSKQLQKPRPPFRLGTPGFMSPEQLETKIPNTQQDIYSIGGLLIFLFTGLMPDKFSLEDLDSLLEQLRFFLSDDKLIDLLVSCLCSDPESRPTIPVLKDGIQEFRKKQLHITSREQENIVSTIAQPNKEELKIIIKNSLKGLMDPMLINSDELWISRSVQEDGFAYDHTTSLSVYTGFYQGISGILWLIAQANKMQFSISSCTDAFRKNLIFIQEKCDRQLPDTSAGLYFGTAGIAIAMAEAVESKIIPNEADILNKIRSYLQNENTNGFGIVKGLSGQGMALLKIMSLLNDLSINNLLRQNTDLLLQQQQKDGSWISKTDKNNNSIKATGFGHGVAGISCFLLSYILKFENDQRIRDSVVKAIHWLISQSQKKDDRIIWPLNTNTRLCSFGFQDGFAGIILALVKAYEVFKDPEYKELAEGCMRGYELYPVSSDITQSSGLIGLGEVYLEAERVFGTGEWQRRADWIAQFILHHFRRKKDGSNHWLPDTTPIMTAGLMEGNSGIIHFLLRFYYPDKMCHPLLIR